MKKSINPLWGARFKQQSSDLLEKINNSIGFDYKLVFQDIRLNSIYSKSTIDYLKRLTNSVSRKDRNDNKE